MSSIVPAVPGADVVVMAQGKPGLGGLGRVHKGVQTGTKGCLTTCSG